MASLKKLPMKQSRVVQLSRLKLSYVVPSILLDQAFEFLTPAVDFLEKGGVAGEGVVDKDGAAGVGNDFALGVE